MERIALYKIVNTDHVPKGAFTKDTIRPGYQSSEYYCKMRSDLGDVQTMGTSELPILGQEVKLIGYAVIKSIK